MKPAGSPHRRARQTHAGSAIAGLGLALGVAQIPSAHAANCSVTVTALSFGIYDTLNVLDGVTTINVSCTRSGTTAETVNFRIDLSGGPGGYAARRMNGSAGGVLLYNLYTDAPRTTVWGNGTAGTSSVFGSLVTQAPPGNAPVVSAKTVYGRIAGSQHVAPGNYATTFPITITVTY
jgi:spore coat protein U-like protein